MKKEYLFEVIGELDDDIVKGAKPPMKVKKQTIWKSVGAMAACLCLVLGGTFLFKEQSVVPEPEFVQVVTPFIEVESVEEMEQYLDFNIPVLERGAETYLVWVTDGYPEMADIRYSDDMGFRMKYGSGDISGIHGGTLEKEDTVNGISVGYYTYETTRYALWEKDGFTYSLTGGENLEEGVAELMK